MEGGFSGKLINIAKRRGEATESGMGWGPQSNFSGIISL